MSTTVVRLVRPVQSSMRLMPRLMAPQIRTYSKFDERENAFENMDVQKHDAELLRKYKEALEAAAKNKVKEQTTSGSKDSSNLDKLRTEVEKRTNELNNQSAKNKK